MIDAGGTGSGGTGSGATGIPAAVMAAEGADRDRPIGLRTVPVGVHPENLERARSDID